MEKENRRRKFLRGLALVVGTTVVCYEIFSRKGQDVKNAYGWVKGKLKNKQPEPVQQVEGQSANNQNPGRGDQYHGKNDFKRN